MKNSQQLLIGMVIFVAITTVAMVIVSQNMVAIKAQASRLFTGSTTRFLATITNTNTNTNNTNASAVHPNISGVVSNASGNSSAKNNLSGSKNISGAADAGKPVTTTTTTTTTTPKPPAPKPAEPTNRPLKCSNCFFSKFRNLTDTPEVCSQSSGGSAQPEMVMLITTTLDGLERRQAIRETWASVTRGNTAHVRHLFLMGTDGQGRVSEALRTESARYGDLLVSDFVDVYGNLTYKTLVGLHYLVDHCSMVKFFLKTDQDMYIFVDRLLGLARKQENTLQKSLGGSCFQTGRPWRDPKTKYYASIRSYPQSTYPGFCSGTGYIGSLNLARKVVEASPNIPFFHLEDVYMSLVLRHLGYKLTKYPGFAEGGAVCRTNSAKAKQTLTIHEVSPQSIREFWAKKCGV